MKWIEWKNTGERERTGGRGLECGVVEWVKQSTLRWYGHVMRMNECDFTKRAQLREGE